MKHLIILFATIAATNFAVAQNTDLGKSYFVDAKQQIENMLNGKEEANYEKAIFIIENAWYENQIDKANFDYAIDSKISAIKQLIKANYDDKVFKKDMNSLYHKPNAEELYNKALANWAIYSYMTNKPYTYSFADPMATEDWRNSQVVNLNNTKQGNCFALASLFKILSSRLNSDATLCTAPSHIYISHEDEKGTSYNIELGSQKFPGTGTLATLTHSTMESIRSNISLRRLTNKQSVALCLVYLAKGYEHKFNISSDVFMMNCAETALKYDSLNLNAMLLKAELLESNLMTTGKSIAQLKGNTEYIKYEKLLVHLYQLGYREIPLDMKNQLIRGWSKDTIKSLAHINYKAAELNASQLLQSRKASLSWGLFDEEFPYKLIERYGNTLFDCKNKEIKQFTKQQSLYNHYTFDPVVFAWNIDPLAHQFPSISPYAFCGNSPILFKDPDGQKLVIYYKDENGKNRAYEYGSKITVPNNKFVLGTIEAIEHIKETEIGNQVVERISNSTEKTLALNEVSKATDFGYLPTVTNKQGGVIPDGTTANLDDIEINTGVLSFNPNIGISFDGDKSISPATALLHEMGHSYSSFFRTSDFLSRINSPNAQFGNDEEMFTTETFENEMARYFNEGIRNHHSGREIQTISPNSTREAVSNTSQLGQGESVDLN